MQERVFMGIGNKPFMDIQPSDAAISDRAVNYVLMGRGKTHLFIILFGYFSHFGIVTLLLITLNVTFSLQKTRCRPLRVHAAHKMASLEVGQNLLVREAVCLLPHPQEGAPCPLWDTCVGQSGGWFQEALEDMCLLQELWRRTTWTTRTEVRTYYVS